MSDGEYVYDSDIDFEDDSDVSDVEDCVSESSYDSDDWIVERLEDEFREENNNIDDTDFIGKSGMKWSKLPVNRLMDENIAPDFVNLRNGSENIETILDSFKLFFDDEIINEIVNNTNNYITSNNKNINLMTRKEVYAAIGILIASGRRRDRKLGFSDMWTTNPLDRRHLYPATMPRNRFKEFFSTCRFDDKATRNARIEETEDKLEAIRFVVNRFVENCRKYYQPKENVTIDERLAVFRGKCPFRVYMKSKPGRYGIKIWTCSDADTGYISNFQIYTGSKNKERELNQGERVVMDLMEDYFGLGLSVTTDNFFTSVQLAEKLLERNTYLTGTMRKNKRDIPPEFLPSRKRELYSSYFGFNDKCMMLTSYVPKKNNAVILLSSKMATNEVNQNNKNKPKIIEFYNKTKGGVDTGDKMTREYSCTRATRRWPFRLFMELIDIAALNAYIIWIKKNPDWRKNDKGKRKIFLDELGAQLVEENIIFRSGNIHLQKPVRESIEIFFKARNINLTEPGPSDPSPVKRLRCVECPRKKDRKTKTVCSTCTKAICVDHTFNICGTCHEKLKNY